MGYDAFGLPAENNAIKTGVHPRQATERVDRGATGTAFHSWGISIDWSREFGTHEPRYYRWTQWIFLKLFERGLAYRKEAAVKWCPHDQTVLANEQVIDGRCERCGHQVELRQLEQWFFRITDYADRLLDDLDAIDWPEHVKAMQRNWIGRSEGAEVVFRCEELGHRLPGVHDAAGHAVRRDLLRDGSRASGRVPAGRRNRARTRGPRVRQSRDHGVGRGPRRGREAEDRRAARPHRDEPGQRRAAADVRRRLRADGVRDGRDHGGARARRARLRVRAGVRPADPTGDRHASESTSCRTPATGRW